jgi:pSer/pThr/pTyr-binding forkhead associated (FHA) protein
MSDQLLNTLKVALLGLLYLFFARVLWAVWTEVRVPTAAGLTASRLKKSGGTKTKGKASQASPSRLLMVEPASMRGSTTSLDDEVLVGRSADCDVTLDNDPFASTRHARFFRKDENWYVEDLGSTNGTLVNSHRITAPVLLRIDDRVQTGTAVFEVH